jgi:hypothetical protein
MSRVSVTKISVTEENDISDHSDEEYDSIREAVLDLTSTIKKRKIALEQYYSEEGDNAIEVVSVISGMYQFSGTSVLEEYLVEICFNVDISPFLKLEAASSLLMFEEFEDCSDDEDYDKDIASKTRQRNARRKKKGFEALAYVCLDMDGVPTPCKISSTFKLMNSPEHKWASDINFREIISDHELECEFRYKTILAVEGRDIKEENFFITSALFEFLTLKSNSVYFRIMAAQYLLTRQKLDKKKMVVVENTVVGFAVDDELNYDRRADAADLLLSVGSAESKNLATNVIIALGNLDRRGHTVFDNAQNVHTEGVESSVAEILESLFVAQEGLKQHSFDSVVSAVSKVVRLEGDSICECDHKNCDKCKICKKSKNKSLCTEFRRKRDALKLALTRIEIDRGIYSVYSLSLSNVLVHLWTYIVGHEHEKDMTTRLIEELVEMSATCSTGYISRLANVLSGFGDFSVRISWEDQIVANFTGRLNAAARNITNNPEYYKSPKDFMIVEMWLRKNPDVLKDMADTSSTYNRVAIGKGVELSENSSIETVTATYLKTDRERKLKTCVEDFASYILDELSEDSTVQYGSRPNFLMFFIDNVSKIREELAQEFKDLISNDSFELYFRKAIMSYEGN